MIRKPSQDWHRRESASVATLRASAAAAGQGLAVARTGTLYLRALVLWAIAAVWGFAALAAGASGSLPTFIGVGAMACGAAYAGRRALVKAQAGR